MNLLTFILIISIVINVILINMDFRVPTIADFNKEIDKFNQLSDELGLEPDSRDSILNSCTTVKDLQKVNKKIRQALKERRLI